MNCYRVKYRIEYNSGTGLYRLPKAPELIKIANVAAPDVFYDSGSDYDPIWVDITALQYDYGQQIFLNLAKSKDMIFTSAAVSEPCLSNVYRFIGFISTFYTTDVPGVDIPGSYVPSGDENILIG